MTDFPPGWALVVGGSGGIGGAVCRRLAAAGLDVALTFRGNARAAAETAEAVRAAGREARTVQLQLEDAPAVERAVAEIEPLQTVIYAAGPSIGQPHVGNVSLEEWRAAVDAEVHGFFHLVRASLPSLRKSRGALVAVTSAGLLRTPPRDILSVAPKAAITALVAAVAREEGRSGVRANCVALGVIEAGMFLRLRQTEYDVDFVEAMRRNTPLRRFGTAEEVAEAVTFLASARAGFITGQTLAVDGGYSV